MIPPDSTGANGATQGFSEKSPSAPTIPLQPSPLRLPSDEAALTPLDCWAWGLIAMAESEAKPDQQLRWHPAAVHWTNTKASSQGVSLPDTSLTLHLPRSTMLLSLCDQHSGTQS